MTVGQGWAVYVSATSPHVHVMPIEDYRPHDFTPTCWCRAEPDDENVITHNSLDQRELFEDLPLQ